MNLIIFLIRYSPAMFLMGMLAALISGLSRAGFIVLTTRLLLQRTHPSTMSVWLLVTMCLLMPVSRLLSQLIVLRIVQQSMYHFVLRLTKNILSAPLRTLEEMGPHQLQAILTTDAATLTDSLASFPEIFLNLTMLAGCLVYLGMMSGLVLSLVAISMCVSFVIYIVLNKWVSGLWQRARENVGTLFRHFNDLLYGVKELKMNQARRNSFYARDLETTAATYKKHNLQANAAQSAVWSASELQFMLLVLFVAVVLPAFTGATDHNAASYVIILLYMTGPMIQLGSLFPLLTRATVALAKMKLVGFSADASPGQAVSGAQFPMDAWQQLELNGVKHSYHYGDNKDSFTLGPLDLTFHAGDIVFIMGGNGSGKTTLAKLLVGLYLPESGSLAIDGVPVTNDNREQYREFFSVIFSPCFIFDEVMGASGSGERLAHDYLKELKLEQRIRIQNGRLSTRDLSQGQRKRVALLNSFLEDRPIYVFDEWAADQDPEFRENFYLYILRELKARKKTVFVISHDDRYSHVADRIVKLDYGVLESDTRTGPVEPLAIIQSNAAS